MKKLSHFDSAGSPRMVDVSAKPATLRTARAHAFVRLAPAVLRQLPQKGPLFPGIREMDDRGRACTFWKLYKRLKIEGISLHSYRYSWAERAKVIGMPQRWAQAALGHIVRCQCRAD